MIALVRTSMQPMTHPQPALPTSRGPAKGTDRDKRLKRLEAAKSQGPLYQDYNKSICQGVPFGSQALLALLTWAPSQLGPGHLPGLCPNYSSSPALGTSASFPPSHTFPHSLTHTSLQTPLPTQLTSAVPFCSLSSKKMWLCI